MEQQYKKYIEQYFRTLRDLYGFRIGNEMHDGRSFETDYTSDCFVIRIEKYSHEFAAIFCKKGTLEEINLFNLIDYLKQGERQVPKARYYPKEKNLVECYRKQLAYLSLVIYANLEIISEFFCEERYDMNVIEFEKYWTRKHAPFSKKWRDV